MRGMGVGQVLPARRWEASVSSISCATAWQSSRIAKRSGRSGATTRRSAAAASFSRLRAARPTIRCAQRSAADHIRSRTVNSSARPRVGRSIGRFAAALSSSSHGRASQHLTRGRTAPWASARRSPALFSPPSTNCSMGGSGELAATSLRRLRRVVHRPLGRGQLSQIAQMGRTARRVGKPTPGEDQPRQASLNLRHCGPRFGLEAQTPPVGRPRAEDGPGRPPPRRRRRRHIDLPAHASVLWQQMVCSSSPFRGAAASSDDVRRGVHSLALALGSVRLV